MENKLEKIGQNSFMDNFVKTEIGRASCRERV